MSLLTVGLGSLSGEAAAAGVEFTTRGRRADEAIGVLRVLWGGSAEGVSLHGEFFDLTEVCSFPKPHAGRVLPVLVGGSSLAAARRAGRRGDGYFPGGRLTRQQRDEQLAVMRAEATCTGRVAEHEPSQRILRPSRHPSHGDVGARRRVPGTLVFWHGRAQPPRRTRLVEQQRELDAAEYL